MYKTDLIRRVSHATHLSQRVINQVLEESLREIQHALKAGDKVTLPGFGSFVTHKQKAGQARNFKTGAIVEVPAYRTVRFRAGELLRKSVRGKKK